jgi:DNA-directed RNA polymerase specialized sigma24 family protein
LSSNESELSLENVDDYFTDCGEMGHQDICAVLKISDTNLWVRLHRARMLLRRRLEARWFGKKADKG